MRNTKFKIATYLIVALFAGILTGSCEKCDDGNNFEDQLPASRATDSISVN